MSLSIGGAASNSRDEISAVDVTGALFAALGTIAADTIAGALEISARNKQRRMVARGFDDCESVVENSSLRANVGIFLMVVAHGLTLVYGILFWRKEVLNNLIRLYVAIIAALSMKKKKIHKSRLEYNNQTLTTMFGKYGEIEDLRNKEEQRFGGRLMAIPSAMSECIKFEFTKTGDYDIMIQFDNN
ncbi:unnamed protein product [Cuscuta campestris]|uniref:Uncharacterized protein n=1 Tax=Cuscuta campestris TaxID=132261 RepID=A0A484KLW9_9ASTE|nr:unnamed protein product [Cuscuta campestris]